ncbi:MAG TPA: hypothetical protein VHZ55_33580 [Bryobacteraceae bacterium]|jgi:hypothetical protein|nr:hypothetical protein [Bryobacteraceae bacterium]
MNADRAEVSWDSDKNKWLVRIIVGEAVIRRYSNEPHGADKGALAASAVKTAADEGYSIDPSNVSVT